MNGYEGVETAPAAFTIEPKNAESDSQIKVPDITADTDLDHLEIKDGDKVLVQGTDYDVTKTQDGNEVTVTITYKGRIIQESRQKPIHWMKTSRMQISRITTSLTIMLRSRHREVKTRRRLLNCQIVQ